MKVQYTLTGGAAAREAELMKTLYQLLDRYKKMPAGGFPMTGGFPIMPGRYSQMIYSMGRYGFIFLVDFVNFS